MFNVTNKVKISVIVKVKIFVNKNYNIFVSKKSQTNKVNTGVTIEVK